MATLNEQVYNDLMEHWKQCDLRELAMEFQRLQAEYAIAKDTAALIYAEFELLRKNVLPQVMEDMGLDTAKVSGVGRIQIGQQASAKQLDKPGLLQWLADNGHDAIIAETVNASTLASFMKAQIAIGDPIPDEEIVKFTVYDVASVVKA